MQATNSNKHIFFTIQIKKNTKKFGGKTKSPYLCTRNSGMTLR